MSAQNVQLPEIGEGVNEGELVSWLVQPGDSVDVDQPIAELMTDKATVEVPSPIAGTVGDLKFAEGDTINVGDTMITVDASAASPKKEAAKPEPQAKTQQEAPKPSAPQGSGGQSQQPMSASSIQPPPADIHVLATPSTRRLAREMQVDVNGLTGSGLAGRVTRDDVLGQSGGATSGTSMNAGMPSPAPYTPEVTFAGGGEERVPLKGIRKKIAENMQAAKRIVPHFTLMDEANVSALVQLRTDLKPHAEKMGIKLSYMPFVFKALIATIREFPKFNAMIDDAAQQIVYKKFFNVGFAADTPNGLLVPVIKNCEQKTIYQMSAEIVDLATRARAGKLKLEEMKNATFTVTNIGSIGGTYATPIINHPEVAIFGMYKLQERPYIDEEGELASAKFMNFTVTCDHRLIDGAEAAKFLSAFIERIENPGRLMMDMV